MDYVHCSQAEYLRKMNDDRLNFDFKQLLVKLAINHCYNQDYEDRDDSYRYNPIRSHSGDVVSEYQV